MMRNYIETKFIKNGKARMIVCAAFIFSLLMSGAFRQSDTATVQAQSSNDAPDSPQATLLFFSNSTPITINDNSTASPYPSIITVSGVNPATVTNVSVELTGLTHTYPDDLDIILVGPQGQRAVLMSDAGGGDNLNFSLLKFDSRATNVLPDETAISSDTYRPANYGNSANDLTDTFPAPFSAPNTLTTASADLSVFNLTNPNGEWKLYVVDDATQDTGAIESGWSLRLTVPTVFTVNSNADTNDGVCNAANCTLREAITAAGDGDLINFNFPILQIIELQSALPNITRSITIQGPGAGLLTVRRAANAATNFRIFSIAGSATNEVAISGMTITGGNVDSGNFGGGIYSNSSLTLTGVHVTGNTASSGGGVGLAFADGTFTKCTFNNNSATNAAGGGGGITYVGNGNRALRVASSTVSGNSSASVGGGINNISSGGNSRLEVVNSTIADNTATSSGGILTSTQGAGSTATTTLRNTIVAGNTPINLATGTAAGGGAATFQTLGFNLSNDFNGVFTPAATDITATPRLAPLAFYRGSTPTHALAFGSPAIDAGNNSGSGVTTDQTGANRTIDLPSVGNAAGSDGTDIGAFETQTAPAAPEIRISDVSQNEGNSGTTDFTFTVSINNANGQPVSVNYQTADGTAIAPTDYTAIGATVLNFAANETSKQITVAVNGDTAVEPNETFFVNLSNASGANIIDNQGQGTIINDDVSISIANVSQNEGNSGTSNFNFAVSLSAASSQTVTVQYLTVAGTASPDSDYTSIGGTVTFAPGETSKNIAVSVNGDTIIEPDETFSVLLTSASNATIANFSAVGTILNDDGACSYTFSPTTPQSVSAGASSIIVFITTQTGCAWTAASNSGFLTVSTASGSGNGSTTISIAANTGAARSGTLTIAGQTYTINQAAGTVPRTRFDFDGDGKADISVFRPSNGAWYLQQSMNGFTGAVFGQNGDSITPADFDGDGKTDLAVYRGGNWYLMRSTLGFTGVQFGIASDLPMPADYDGDGKADICVFRPSDGNWYMLRSSTGAFAGFGFGQSGDVPVAADYDADGKADIAVFRPSNGAWYLQRSQLGFTGFQFGQSGDKPVPADYDGDGKADAAVFRPSNGSWYLNRSTAGFTGVQFGISTDVPVAADYDGDGKADVAVYRTNTWYLQNSTTGFTGIQFGSSGDKPAPNAFVP